MAKIEFRRVDDLPYHRSKDVVPPELAAKLSGDELESRSRVHFPGDDERPQLFEVVAIPNAVFNAHAHDIDEIILVVDGELHAGSQVLHAGESMFVPGGTVYAFRAGPDGLRFFNFRPHADHTHRSAAEARALRA